MFSALAFRETDSNRAILFVAVDDSVFLVFYFFSSCRDLEYRRDILMVGIYICSHVCIFLSGLQNYEINFFLS